MTVSMVMIARNNEATIGAALWDAHEAGCVELVVVDTGSTDQTPNIAADAYGALVSLSPWRDDFAFHRNEAIEKATGEWVLILDSDDRIFEPKELARFIRLDIPRLPANCDAVQFRVSVGVGAHITALRQVRMIRKSSGIRYRFPVHEVPDCRGHDTYQLQESGIVHHVAEEQSHQERNLRILERARYDGQWQTRDEETKQHIRLNLGRELLGAGRNDEAILELRDYVASGPMENRMDYWANLYLALAMLKCEYGELMRQLDRTIKCNPWRAEAYVEKARQMINAGHHEGARTFLAKALRCPVPTDGTVHTPDYTWRPAILMAVALQKCGDMAGAMRFAKLAEQRGVPPELIRDAIAR